MRLDHGDWCYQVMQISKATTGDQIKFDVLEQLALNPFDAIYRLPVASMAQGSEIEVGPLRKQAVARP
jgi:hypothetical protein